MTWDTNIVEPTDTIQDLRRKIEQLEADNDYLKSRNLQLESKNKGLSNLLDLRERQLKRSWISVEERLPDEMGYVLVHTDTDEIIFGFYQTEIKCWCDDEGCKTIVTHWQPSPEAPKGFFL